MNKQNREKYNDNLNHEQRRERRFEKPWNQHHEARYRPEMDYGNRPKHHLKGMEGNAYRDGRFNPEMKYRNWTDHHIGRRDRNLHWMKRCRPEIEGEIGSERYGRRIGRGPFRDGQFNVGMKYRTKPERRFGRRYHAMIGYPIERQTMGAYRKPIHRRENTSRRSLIMKKANLEQRIYHLKKRLRLIERTLDKRYAYQQAPRHYRGRPKNWAY